MRSPREIQFRLRQELRNLQLLAFPPKCRKCATDAAWPLTGLPAPNAIAEKLETSDFAAAVLQVADEILAHRFPLLGFTIEAGREIEWRRDYVAGISTGTKYFRLVPYLDAARAGDHKNIWELNRHQHLVLLAQAFLFSGRAAYLDEIFLQLNSWCDQNPYQRGINWTSALEVAFRAFSWLWVYHLAGNRMDGQFRARFLQSLYQHGRHIENNLSFYFSPNTHLLGEAVVLHALGQLFPSFPRARKWVELGGATVSRELKRQVHRDGSHFEQSTYYHVYALDMFLFHAAVSNPSREYLDTLARMADYLHAVMGPARSLPFLGDDDGGRWFHPYGARDQFGRATLATCAALLERRDWTFDTLDLYPQAAWWLGRTEGSARGHHQSRLFRDSGIAVLESGSGRAMVDSGPFGPGRAGHSHSDCLSVIASTGERHILVDSGTYTYVGDRHQRDAFRGSAAHNTIRVDGCDQAVEMGPFWWADPPRVDVVSWEARDEQDQILGECRYQGITHRRLVRLMKPHLIFVLDWLDGPGGEHELEQFWHPASPEARAQVFLGSAIEERECWHSRVFGSKHAARCLVVRRRTAFPTMFAATVSLDAALRIAVVETPDRALFEVSGGPTVEIAWPKPD
jgi:hypothetical protein